MVSSRIQAASSWREREGEEGGEETSVGIGGETEGSRRGVVSTASSDMVAEIGAERDGG